LLRTLGKLTRSENAWKTVIVISHDDRFYLVADRLIKVENGQVVSDTSFDTLLTPQFH
jgi:ABC-type siderophore export system fused ATPase/permease subunit